MWRKVWKKMWTILIALGLGLREGRLSDSTAARARGAHSPSRLAALPLPCAGCSLAGVAGEARGSAESLSRRCPRFRCRGGLAVSAAPTQRTRSQLELARLVATGATNAEIANSLCISVDTVKTHTRRTLRKLGLRSRTELALHLSRDPRLELDGIKSDHLEQLRQGQRPQQLT